MLCSDTKILRKFFTLFYSAPVFALAIVNFNPSATACHHPAGSIDPFKAQGIFRQLISFASDKLCEKNASKEESSSHSWD